MFVKTTWTPDLEPQMKFVWPVIYDDYTFKKHHRCGGCGGGEGSFTRVLTAVTTIPAAWRWHLP